MNILIGVRPKTEINKKEISKYAVVKSGKRTVDGVADYLKSKGIKIIEEVKTLEEVRGEAEIKERETKAKQRKRANSALTIRAWIALTGGVNPQDPTWKGELRDISTDMDSKGRLKRAKGF